MCGIAGIYNNSGVSTDRSIIAGMAAAIAHRGPDEEGFHLARRVHLASRRLSIIDLDAGAQPIFNRDKTLCIVYNGEIYNYLQLRRQLSELGYPFQTKTDTEVILAAYSMWGKESLNRLQGMFAFCIWDAAKKELFLARDRFGIKPLYLCELFEGTLIFASEIKALLQHPYVTKRIHPQAIQNLLTYGFNTAPHTFFENIYQVLPGHYLCFSPRGRKDVQYWDIDMQSQPLEGDMHDLCDQFRRRFEQAVKKSLVADVPVAAYLSGGIDSSAVAGVYSKLSNKKITTITITFDEAGYDETAYSRQVSEFCHAENIEFACSITPDDIQTLVYSLENPLVSLLNLPLFLLSQKTAQAGIKVVLSGDGADEFLGGYDYFKLLKTMAFIERTDSPARLNLLRRIYPDLRTHAEADALFVNLKNAAERFPHAEQAIPYRFNEFKLKQQLLSPGFFRLLQITPRENPFFFDMRNIAHRPLMDQALYIETKMRLLNLTLPLSDKMSMANSVEVRPLFLDHDFVDFCFTIPHHYKIQGLAEKYILKKSMTGLVPPEVCRRRKQPLQPPGRWFLKNAGELLLHYLDHGKIKQFGYFNPSFVDFMLSEHDRHAKVDYSGILVVVFFVQLWHDIFLEG